MSDFSEAHATSVAVSKQLRYEKENLEFQIQFATTNLRYLAGEPDSERKTRCVWTNQEGIASAKKRLKEIEDK